MSGTIVTMVFDSFLRKLRANEFAEVVLHSLDAEAPEIIKIANGHVTERSEGAPITNLARMKLRDEWGFSNRMLDQVKALGAYL